MKEFLREIFYKSLTIVLPLFLMVGLASVSSAPSGKKISDSLSRGLFSSGNSSEGAWSVTEWVLISVQVVINLILLGLTLYVWWQIPRTSSAAPGARAGHMLETASLVAAASKGASTKLASSHIGGSVNSKAYNVLGATSNLGGIGGSLPSASSAAKDLGCFACSGSACCSAKALVSGCLGCETPSAGRSLVFPSGKITPYTELVLQYHKQVEEAKKYNGPKAGEIMKTLVEGLDKESYDWLNSLSVNERRNIIQSAMYLVLGNHARLLREPNGQNSNLKVRAEKHDYFLGDYETFNTLLNFMLAWPRTSSWANSQDDYPKILDLVYQQAGGNYASLEGVLDQIESLLTSRKSAVSAKGASSSSSAKGASSSSASDTDRGTVLDQTISLVFPFWPSQQLPAKTNNSGQASS